MELEEIRALERMIDQIHERYVGKIMEQIRKTSSGNQSNFVLKNSRIVSMQIG